MVYAEMDPGHVIYREKDFGTCFFYIERGEIEVTNDRGEKKKFVQYDGKLPFTKDLESSPCYTTLSATAPQSPFLK